jgi:hypothetical protein
LLGTAAIWISLSWKFFLPTNIGLRESLYLLFPYLNTGTFLAVPAGMYKADASAATLNGTYIFKRSDW